MDNEAGSLTLPIEVRPADIARMDFAKIVPKDKSVKLKESKAVQMTAPFQVELSTGYLAGGQAGDYLVVDSYDQPTAVIVESVFEASYAFEGQPAQKKKTTQRKKTKQRATS